MFDKIISALPYNPSLIHQLSFYSKRVRKEAAVRKVGIVFIVLAFLIQFFAFISPPQLTSALAGSPNDLVSGGFINRAMATSDCESTHSDYGAILRIYGITCQEVSTARTITLHSTDYNRDLFSMGRDAHNLAGEQPVPVGNETLYIRYLWGWDSPGTVSTYQALVTRSSTGQLMFLLYTCGNLVSVGKPVQVSTPKPPVTKPKPKPLPCTGVITAPEFKQCVTTTKKAINLTQGSIDATSKPANANDLIRYYLYATNEGSGVVKDYQFSDNLTYVLDYAHIAVLGTGRIDTADQTITYPIRNIGPHQTSSVYFEVRVNSPIPQTTPPPSDPEYFNMEMVNTYEQTTIVIHLPLSPTQTIETVTTGTTATPAVLPNTGPGMGVFIAGAITAIAGFFFYRSRLLSKESAIAIRENSGGM